MKLEPVHDGGAVSSADGAIWRLKDLLPADQLRHPAVATIVEATQEGERSARLRLSDGSQHLVALPGPRAEAAADQADLVIGNIGQLLTMTDDEASPLGLVNDAVVACQDGRIIGVYTNGTRPTRGAGCRTVDAGGGIVTPGLIDPHTHPVFAGDRSVEFGMKAEGRSYLEIHNAGGGILSTVRATRAATRAELRQACARNLSRLLRWGVTTCEAKSGYALEVEGELRMLEALRTVGETHPVDVVPTLLGAHAVPPEHKQQRERYVELVIEEMIPRAARDRLARYCDAYCEDGAFTTEEVRRIFEAARRAGLGLRLHAEQFSDQGGAQLAAELGAASADHLEEVSAEGIEAMARAGTVAVLLPGAALTCRCPWPPARELADAGVPLALGTDLNPGTSLTASLPLMMSLACTQMRVSCEEAWLAVTLNAARAIGRRDIGRIEPGARADLVLFDVPDYRYVPYHYGENHARLVIKSGRVVVDRGARDQRVAS